MRVFFSGGSPIVETVLDKPDIMPTFYTDVRKGKPCARLARLMKLRKKDKRRKK